MSYFQMGTLSVNELGWYTLIKKKCSNMDLNKAFNLMLKCVPNATLGMHINPVVISILKNQLSMLSVVSQESSKWTMRQFSIPFFLDKSGFYLLYTAYTPFCLHASCKFDSFLHKTWLVSSVCQLGKVVTAQKKVLTWRKTHLFYSTIFLFGSVVQFICFGFDIKTTMK